MTRPVVLPWHCQRSGDCCASVSQIVMTHEEADVVSAHTAIPLTFYIHPDRRFVYLAGKPCPLLDYERNAAGERGAAVCTVHAVRPYNCRRFGCFRPDVRTEPYEPEPLDLPRLRLGCANLSDRLANRKVRKAYALMQRKAARWALTHGWDRAMTGTPAGSDVTFYRRNVTFYQRPSTHTP